MARKPLLIFPRATSASKDSLQTFAGNFHLPTKERQVVRLDEKISNIERVLENQTAYLGDNPANLVSEMILVLEIAGDLKDFFSAVNRIEGMEFISELQSQLDPDDDFYAISSRNEERLDRSFGARLFLTMTNQAALRELRSMWNEYKRNPDDQQFREGTRKFKILFDKLKDLRPYSVADRIIDTGLQDYLEDMRQLEIGLVNFEVELAFKNVQAKDDRAFDEVVSLLGKHGGSVIPNSRITLPEIGYHAFIAQAPIASFDDLSENTNVVFLKCQQILFFRPVGQSIFNVGDDQELGNYVGENNVQPTNDLPVIALFDGLPLANHSLLSGRLRIDDPDNFQENYLAANRFHGTAMASLILNGDLNEEARTLTRPIYVRPILKPIGNGFARGEFLPDDKLPIDIIHRAVKRMFEGEDGQEPTAPTVKFINFSIGDPYRPFIQNVSTWAKLLDWLSYKYNVLFIVSAGNISENFELNIPANNFNQATSEQI